MNIARFYPIKNTIKQYARRDGKWRELKTVAVVSGLSGCGKTTLILDCFKDKRCFYFSFAGLEESIAEKLFANKVTMATGKSAKRWDDAFRELSDKYKFIILDDLSSVSSYKRFINSFFENICKDFNTRPLVFLLAQPTDNIDGLADNYHCIGVSFFSIPECIKVFPSLSKFDTLGLCVASGGIPKILKEYDEEKAFEDNMRALLVGSSVFVEFMPNLMGRYFRKPEIYHSILYAIANGNHRISEIGKFTGYAYNKCDNYISVLVSVGIIKIEKEKSKKGTRKTAYVFANSYFNLWYKYVYINQSEIAVGNVDVTESIVKSIIATEIHVFHLQKAFAYVNARVNETNFWAVFQINEKIIYAPQTVRMGDFKYTFDVIHRNGDKAVFVKVFADPAENCKKDEYRKIFKAVSMANTFDNSHVFIFTKRRFSDYAEKYAPMENNVSIVEVERLKYS